MDDRDQASSTQGVDETPMRAREREVTRVLDALEAQRSEPITLRNVEDAFRYHPWDQGQQDCGDVVRDALVAASKAILRSVPPGRLRTRCLDDLIEIRMRANAAITFRGRF